MLSHFENVHVSKDLNCFYLHSGMQSVNDCFGCPVTIFKLNHSFSMNCFPKRYKYNFGVVVVAFNWQKRRTEVQTWSLFCIETRWQ